MARPSLTVALCAVLLLCTGALAHEIVLREELSPDEERLTSIADMEGNGGIQGWVNMGKGFREMCTPGWPDIQELTAGGGDFQTMATSIAQYLAGMLAIVGLCLIFAILSFCNLLCFYCCRRMCGQAEPSRDYTKGDQICAFVTLGVAMVLVVVGISVGIASNALISQGIEDIVFSLNHTVSDVMAFPDQILGTLESVTVGLNDTVNNIVTEITAVPNSIGDDLDPIVDGVTTRMHTMQGHLDELLEQANAIETLVSSIMASVNSINLKVTDINNKFADLAEDHIEGTYSWKMVNCIPSAFPIDYDLDVDLPSFQDVIDDVEQNNLSVIATDIEQQFDSIRANMSSMIDEQLGSVMGTIYDSVGSVSDQAQDAIDSTVGTYAGSVEDVRSEFMNIYNQYVVEYNGYRNSGMIAFFAVSFAVLLFVILGFVFHQSMLFSCAGNLAWLFMIFLWLLCALHFLVAAILGKGCELLITLDISVVAPQFADDPMYEQFLAVYEECQLEEGNIAEFFNLTEQIDLDSYVDQYLNVSMFTDVLDSFNMTEALSALDQLDDVDVTGLLSDLVDINVDYEIDADISQTIDDAIDLNEDAIQALEGTIGQAVCWQLGGDEVAAEAAYTVAIDDINTDIAELNTNELATLKQNIAQLQVLLDQFSAAANASLPAAEDLMDHLLTLDNELIALTDDLINQIVNQTLPNVFNEVRGFIYETRDQIVSLADCYWIAQDINAVRNSLCVVLLGGFDGVYWAAGGLATFLFVSIIGIVLTAKRWALNYDQALAGKMPAWLGGSRYDDANVQEYEMSDKYDTTRKDQYY